MYKRQDILFALSILETYSICFIFDYVEAKCKFSIFIKFLFSIYKEYGFLKAVLEVGKYSYIVNTFNPLPYNKEIKLFWIFPIDNIPSVIITFPQSKILFELEEVKDP